MRKFFSIVLTIFTIFVLVLLNKNNQTSNDEYLRFHVRANSNASFDQYVKYDVKDKIILLIEPFLKNFESFDEAYEFLQKSRGLIEAYANNLLEKHNCDYGAKVEIRKEYFDEKEGNGFVLREGLYNSMIVSLGEEKGNNWWCLVYPSLSFVPNSSDVDYANISYKSKIVEIYNTIK